MLHEKNNPMVWELYLNKAITKLLVPCITLLVEYDLKEFGFILLWQKTNCTAYSLRTQICLNLLVSNYALTFLYTLEKIKMTKDDNLSCMV